jgi:hypothetical protein
MLHIPPISRIPLLVLLAVSGPLGCELLPPEGLFPQGYVDEAWMEARQLDYLGYATESLSPGSPLSALVHMEREARDPGYDVPDGSFAAGSWDAIFARIATMEDTTDFDLLYLLNTYLAFAGHPAVDSALWDETRQAFLDFKYWYSDPTPAGLIDDKWYWSENHQAIFHTLEYLAGQTFPDEVFTITGWTGVQHRERARGFLLAWFDHKARFGFDEWHSNVYYQKDVTPLLTLVEHCDDPEIATKAAILLDRVLLDIALHSFRGSFGATAGRTYKKDKTNALLHDTYGLAKLLFDDSELPYTSRADAGASLLARAKKYRLPQVILDVARSQATFVDRERMGVYLDEFAPVFQPYPPPYGFEFTEENIGVYWSMSALTVWQVLPIVWDVAYEYNLWESELFLPYKGIRDAVGSLEFAQLAAHTLAPAAAAGLLKEVDTYTFRTPDYMMSTAQDYRKGSRGAQYHSWQATFGTHAQVFTTHPGTPPRATLDWSSDGDAGNWTGTASQPRSAQHENVAIHLYAPQYQPLSGTAFDALTRSEPYTHAFLPQDHFDEVVRDGHWTFARYRDGYLALYSWRLAEFVDHGAGVARDGMVLPWDLIAAGGPDNVWIVECGRATDWDSFAAFQAAVRNAPLTIEAVTTGLPGGARPPFFEVSYQSPSQGQVQFSWTGPLTVEGVVVPLTGSPRMDNPWAQVPFEDKRLFAYDEGTRAGLWHDLEAGKRAAFRAP